MYRRSRDEGFGAEVKRRIMLGTYALSAGYYDAYYLKAQKVRTLLTRDFDEAFGKVDAIVTPTSPTAAFRLGEKSNDPLAMYLADIYTVTADLAGIPGISIPCGETKEKLPIGLQILGKHFDEATILRVAHAYEQSRLDRLVVAFSGASAAKHSFLGAHFSAEVDAFAARLANHALALCIREILRAVNRLSPIAT